MIRRSIDHPERPETEERVRAFLFTYSRLRRARPGKLAAHEEGEDWAQDTLLMCTDLRGDIPDALVESTAATVAIDSVRKTLAVLERTVPDLSLGTGWTESDSIVRGVGPCGEACALPHRGAADCASASASGNRLANRVLCLHAVESCVCCCCHGMKR